VPVCLNNKITGTKPSVRRSSELVQPHLWTASTEDCCTIEQNADQRHSRGPRGTVPLEAPLRPCQTAALGPLCSAPSSEWKTDNGIVGCRNGRERRVRRAVLRAMKCTVGPPDPRAPGRDALPPRHTPPSRLQQRTQVLAASNSAARFPGHAGESRHDIHGRRLRDRIPSALTLFFGPNPQTRHGRGPPPRPGVTNIADLKLRFGLTTHKVSRGFIRTTNWKLSRLSRYVHRRFDSASTPNAGSVTAGHPLGQAIEGLRTNTAKTLCTDQRKATARANGRVSGRPNTVDGELRAS